MSYHFAEKGAPAGAPLILTFHGTGGDEQQFQGDCCINCTFWRSLCF